MSSLLVWFHAYLKLILIFLVYVQIGDAGCGTVSMQSQSYGAIFFFSEKEERSSRCEGDITE